MMPNPAQPKNLASDWQDARRVYSIYRGIAQRFSLSLPPCTELEVPAPSAAPETVARAQNWLKEADDLIQVHELRLFLQTSNLSTESSVRALVRHYLKKTDCSSPDREKLDFLLVQYFSQCAPAPILMADNPTFSDVAETLKPVLGTAPSERPGWLDSLENILQRMNHCASMRELLHLGILSKVREVKASVEDAYVGVAGLIGITRINFLMRQTFFRLMRADLEAIRQGARQLEQRGVSVIDCTRAQLSATEPIARVLELAQQWKKPFRAEYSAGNPFVQLAELRAAVEAAMGHSIVANFSSAASLAKPAGPVHSPEHSEVPSNTEPRESTAQTSAVPASTPPAISPQPSSTPIVAITPAKSPDAVASAASKGMEALPVTAPVQPAPAGSKNAGLAVAPPMVSSGVASAPARSEQSAAAATPKQATKPSVGPGARAGGESVDAQTSVQPAFTEELKTVATQLSNYLLANRARNRSTGATIVVGSARLVLSSWEVTAFVDGDGPFSEIIRQGVAVRVLLFQALEQARQGGSKHKLMPALDLARNEMTKVQQAASKAREMHNIEATVTLSATSQQLAAMLDQAEASLKP